MTKSFICGAICCLATLIVPRPVFAQESEDGQPAASESSKDLEITAENTEQYVEEIFAQADEIMFDEELDELAARRASFEFLEAAIKKLPKNEELLMKTARLYGGHAIFLRRKEAENKDVIAAHRRCSQLTRRALETKEELTEQERFEYARTYYNDSCCAALENDTEQALTSLEKAIELGFDSRPDASPAHAVHWAVKTIEKDNTLDSIRNDNRFKAILDSLRGQLPPDWQQP